MSAVGISVEQVGDIRSRGVYWVARFGDQEIGRGDDREVHATIERWTAEREATS